jgi:hypothetical protein
MNCAILIVVLILTIVAFFGIARGIYAESGAFQVILRVIDALPSRL